MEQDKGGNGFIDYDFRTKESRQYTCISLYERFKMHRMPQTLKWKKLEDYYNNNHFSVAQLEQLIQEKGWDFEPPVLTDPFIQVESQIDTNIPIFQFRGRDNNLDPEKAKLREEVTKYICYINHLELLNTINERRLNKLGDAFWKVSFDKSITGPGFIGEISVGNPSPAYIFMDSAAYELDDCEVFFYSYRLHKRKARRLYGKAVAEVGSDGNHGDTEIFAANIDVNDDSVQVFEMWYKDDDEDIACSININGIEVKWIKKYWENTASSGNKMYPFVKYSKIPQEQSQYGKGEIETIMPLIDAADREFQTGIMNDMFMANDIIIQEDGALMPGEEMSNIPGAIVKVSAGKANGIRRLGGVQNNSGLWETLNVIHEKVMETNGNFATKGNEPTRVTTASGLAQLREDRDSRASNKKADRKMGFQKLYELIDWTALEFYNTNRVIMISPENPDGDRQPQTYNSQSMGVQDPRTMEVYYPRIDCEITVGDGVQNSKAFTLAASSDLAKLQVTPANAGIIKSIIDIMNLPNKKELKENVDMAAGLAQQQQQIEMQNSVQNQAMGHRLPGKKC